MKRCKRHSRKYDSANKYWSSNKNRSRRDRATSVP